VVEGTTTVENFWYWRVELSADGASWTTLYRQESPASGGRLMEFNTSTVGRGRYQMCLIVVMKDVSRSLILAADRKSSLDIGRM
jgi:hypothetical protein